MMAHTQRGFTMSELTFNEARKMVAVLGDAQAAKGWGGLSAYVLNMYGNPSPEPAEQCMQDLLGDLLHLSDALSLVPGSALIVDDAQDIVDELGDDMDDEDEANEARAGNGWVAFFAYTAEKHLDVKCVNVSASLNSFIADLKQLAAVTGLDFDKINAGAIATHQSELQEP